MSKPLNKQIKSDTASPQPITYTIGSKTFMVEPRYSESGGEPLDKMLLRMMLEKLKTP